ncbi:hypothetical protein JTE90_010346 [Oedothorax gibbosus]|uniref:Receptor ligand binding region domain-containing protein n=1 Tax=Oedothorax gibbosus TaxID=931172 RepID=A0AAV6U1B2_9ARAC|nr:hypothetical protein JTE90_010346 [Oedothorax gibbosus]
MGYERLVLCFWMSLTVLTAVWGRPDNIRVVGLFDIDDADDYERHMRYALDKLNSNRTILPRKRLFAQIIRMMPDENFHVAKKVCSQVDVGTLAIVGSYLPSKLPVVHSASAILAVPHISTAPAAVKLQQHLQQRVRTRRRVPRSNFSLFLYPPDRDLGKAYRDIVTSRGWKSFTLIYDNPRSLPRLLHLLMMGNDGEVGVT